MRISTIAVLAVTLLVSADAAPGQVGWVQQDSPVSANLRSVVVRDPDTAWISGALGTILHTVDGGATWSPRESGTSYTLRGIDIDPAGIGIAVGEGGTILRSTNEGVSWSVIRTDWMDTFDAVDVIDGEHACAVGVNAIFQPWVARTTDGGQTWDFTNFYINGNEGRLTGVRFVDTLRGFATAALWDGTGAIVRTTNGGASWAPLSTTAYALFALDFGSDQNGIAVGLNGNFLRTTDGGANWSMGTTGSGNTLLGISMCRGTTAVAVGEGGTAFRSDDSGATWTPQSSGTGVSLRAVSFVSFEEIGTAVGDGGTILWTVTGGMTGAGVDPGPEEEARLRMAPSRPNPFRGTTALAFSLSEPSEVTVEIFDAQGRRCGIYDAGQHGGGTHEWVWSGTTPEGNTLPRGVYLARITAYPLAGLGPGRVTAEQTLVLLGR